MTTVPLAVICSRFTTVPLLPLCSPTTRAFCVDDPVSVERAAHQDEHSPVPDWPTIACCWALSTAPPASVSAPPLSTTTDAAAGSLGRAPAR